MSVHRGDLDYYCALAGRVSVTRNFFKEFHGYPDMHCAQEGKDQCEVCYMYQEGEIPPHYPVPAVEQVVYDHTYYERAGDHSLEVLAFIGVVRYKRYGHVIGQTLLDILAEAGA